MSKLTILLIIGLSAGVMAKPYQNDKISHALYLQSDRFSDNFLIQLYERFLQIHPAKRPELEDQLTYDYGRTYGSKRTEDQIFDEFAELEPLSDSKITNGKELLLGLDSAIPTSEEDRPEIRTLKKEALELVDRERKQPKLDSAKETQTTPDSTFKTNELQLPASRGTRHETVESVSSRYHPKGIDKQDKQQRQEVQKLPKKEIPRTPSLVQINVNIAQAPINSKTEKN